MFDRFKKKEDGGELDDRISALCDILAEKHKLSRDVVSDIMGETTHFVRKEVTEK